MLRRFREQKSGFGLHPPVGNTSPQVFVRLLLPRLQFLHELRWDWNLSFLVYLRCPIPIQLVAHPDLRDGELYVRAVGTNDFLLTHSRHQEKLEPESLFIRAGLEEHGQFFRLVHLQFLLGGARPIRSFPRDHESRLP